MLQFWNMFNAKAFMTGKSAFSGMLSCKWFLVIAIVIFFGQILIVEVGGQMFNVCHLEILLIVEVGGQMFNVCHLEILDWLIIVGATSIVLWIGEIVRAIRKR